MKKYLYVGVDVGGTKIAAALINDKGKILSRAKEPTPLNAKPRLILNALRELIQEILDEADVHKKNIRGMGIGIPGLVDAAGSEILRTPNVHLEKFPIVKWLKKDFPIPIVLGNDVNLGLLGEQWLGAGRLVQNIVGIFPGTGVGGGIILNGNLLTGPQGLAAEIGHMTMDLKGPLCHCGNHGCLEAFVGRWAIERDIRKHIAHGEKSIVVKWTGGKIRTIKSKLLKRALKSRDHVVTLVMHNAAETLGRACVSLNHLLNPELIILGGGVIEACGDFLLPLIQKEMKADPFFNNLSRCQVATAKLGDDAVVLGAVALVQSQFRIKPAVRRLPRGQKLR